MFLIEYPALLYLAIVAGRAVATLWDFQGGASVSFRRFNFSEEGRLSRPKDDVLLPARTPP